MKIRYYSMLQQLGMALIIAPEPLTTIAGIGLLGYTTHAKRQEENKRSRIKIVVRNLYNYKIRRVNDSTLTFQISTTRQGQLPLIWPGMTKIYQRPRF